MREFHVLSEYISFPNKSFWKKITTTNKMYIFENLTIEIFLVFLNLRFRKKSNSVLVYISLSRISSASYSDICILFPSRRFMMINDQKC